MISSEGYDRLSSEFVSAASCGPETGELLRGLRELIQTEAVVCDRRDESNFMLIFLQHLLDEPNPSQTELRAAVSSTMHILGSILIPLLAHWSEVESIDRTIEVVRNSTETLEEKVRLYRRRVGGGNSGGSRRKKREQDLDAAACALNKLYSYSNGPNPTLDDIANQLLRDQAEPAYRAKGGWHRRVRSLSKREIKLRADRLRSRSI